MNSRSKTAVVQACGDTFLAIPLSSLRKFLSKGKILLQAKALMIVLSRKF
jgi:hypothetical protein